MPESMLLCFSVLGVYFFSKWLSSEKPGYFVLSAVFVSLACLIKIPTLYIGLPLLYLAWLKFGKVVFAKKSLWLYASLVFGSVALWYYHAHMIYLQSGLTFGIWGYGTDKWGNWDMVASWGFWYRIFFERLAEKHFTIFGFILLTIGFSFKAQTR